MNHPHSCGNPRHPREGDQTWVQDGWITRYNHLTGVGERVPRMVRITTAWLPVNCGYVHRHTDNDCSHCERSNEMSVIFKPMLATDYEEDKLRLPVLASPKLDGVRAIIRDGYVYSRSNKLIPNKYVQKLFKHLDFFDGELVVGDPTSPTCYRDTVSGVMSEDGEPDVWFYVFDHIGDLTLPYTKRAAQIARQLKKTDKVRLVEQIPIEDLEGLAIYEARMLDLGYEGVMVRDQNAPYKQGRSTVREGYLLKVKRFMDAEATIVGFEERMHNGNEATINELGRTKRSSHKANKSGRGDLGALIVEMDGMRFNIGTGFTDAERAEIWNNKDKYLGKQVKFKYLPVGMKDLPRHPVYLGLRAEIDT